MTGKDTEKQFSAFFGEQLRRAGTMVGVGGTARL